MAKGLTISRQHGLNPCLELCFFCQEAKGVLLFGRLPDDAEAPRAASIDEEPCDKCKEFMSQGVILISARDDSDDMRNPYRSGGWVVVKDHVIENFPVSDQLRVSILKARFSFISDAVWDMIGLPRGDEPTPEEG